MKTANLFHKHGGAIVSLDVLQHSTIEGRPVIEFLGRVQWSDGKLSEAAHIPTSALTCDDTKNKSLVQALTHVYNYVVNNGVMKDGTWVPNASSFSVRLPN
jgi:hypothetical protein